MLVVLAYHAGDRAQAVELAHWMAELGGCKGHRLLALRDAGAAPIEIEFAGLFDSVQELVVRNDVWKQWPESPNLMFRTAAKHIQYTTPEPWLWWEPDAVLLRAGGVDELQAEWQRGQKPFMGDFVAGMNGGPDRMSGIGIYPGKLTNYAGKATIAMEIPWDLDAATQIRPKAHFTKLIQNIWKRPEFKSMEEVRAVIRPEAVLFHSSKDGSLIRLLRENLSHPAVAVTSQPEPIPPDEITRLFNSLPPPETRPAKPIVDENGCFVAGLGETTRTVPWLSSKLASEQAIRRLCTELKRYCTSPVYTGIVRRELSAAKVVPITKKKRRKTK